MKIYSECEIAGALIEYNSVPVGQKTRWLERQPFSRSQFYRWRNARLGRSIAVPSGWGPDVELCVAIRPNASAVLVGPELALRRVVLGGVMKTRQLRNRRSVTRPKSYPRGRTGVAQLPLDLWGNGQVLE